MWWQAGNPGLSSRLVSTRSQEGDSIDNRKPGKHAMFRRIENSSLAHLQVRCRALPADYRCRSSWRSNILLALRVMIDEEAIKDHYSSDDGRLSHLLNGVASNEFSACTVDRRTKDVMQHTLCICIYALVGLNSSLGVTRPRDCQLVNLC